MAVPRGAAERGREALARFRKEYGERYSYLRHGTGFQLLVAVILSAQTPDALTNKVTPELFRRWPTPHALARADVDEVRAAIRPVNFSHGKAQRIVDAARMVEERFGGKVPRAMADLLEIPGVGRKTANVVQGHLFDESEGVGVDTHVKRVSYRLALTTEEDPEKVETDLNRVFEPRDYPSVNFYFIAHGRAICRARAPKCSECVVTDVCPKKGVARKT